MSDAERKAEEALRRLRSTIKYADRETPIRSVLVVDVDRDSPSGLGAGLADAFNRAGDRTRFVNADRRTGPSREPGLTDLIEDSEDASGIVAGMSLTIPVGTNPEADVLTGNGFDRALELLLNDCSYVVLCCAPLPDYGDAVALAPRVDAIILSVSSGETRRAKAVEAKEALERVGAPILGFVMIERGRKWF
ncbi:MAG: hypothetical protein ACOC9Y_08395 [Chloroflexota bacterium]